MELNWTTFFLEIVNFLVLVWILKRFLYKPVLDVIARRREGIEKTLTDAEALHSDAEKLQARYERRLADWDQERQRAREVLERELADERNRAMAELQTALEKEREKAHVTEARRQAAIQHTIEERALLQAARFATRLLEQASGPDLEARLVDIVINEMTRLPAERLTALRNSGGRAPAAVRVASAFSLSEEQHTRLKQALETVAGANTPVQFEQNSDLLAGLRITVGDWELAANLRDELKGFTELAHAD